MYAKIKLTINIINIFSVIGAKCNKFLNKNTANKYPSAVVVHKNVLILVNGLHASITANTLIPPIATLQFLLLLHLSLVLVL